MHTKTIQKYGKLSTPKLKAKAQRCFNAFIRARDLDQYGYFECISCGKRKQASFNRQGSNYHASHYIAAGVCEALRFNENNVNGGCIQCNYYKHGNLIEYGIRLEKKIGKKAVAGLHKLHDYWKRSLKKWTRIELIEIIERYK